MSSDLITHGSGGSSDTLPFSFEGTAGIVEIPESEQEIPVTENVAVIIEGGPIIDPENSVRFLVEVKIVTFGYSQGAPQNIDYYFDLRNLCSHWDTCHSSHQSNNACDSRSLFKESVIQEEWERLSLELGEWIALVAGRAMRRCPGCAVLKQPWISQEEKDIVVATTRVGIGCQTGCHCCVGFAERLYNLGLPSVLAHIPTVRPPVVKARFNPPTHRDLQVLTNEDDPFFSKMTRVCPICSPTANAKFRKRLGKKRKQLEESTDKGPEVPSVEALLLSEERAIQFNSFLEWNSHQLSSGHARQMSFCQPSCHPCSLKESSEEARLSNNKETQLYLKDRVVPRLVALSQSISDVEKRREAVVWQEENDFELVKTVISENNFGEIQEPVSRKALQENGPEVIPSGQYEDAGDVQIRVKLVPYSCCSLEGHPSECDYFIDLHAIPLPSNKMQMNADKLAVWVWELGRAPSLWKKACAELRLWIKVQALRAQNMATIRWEGERQSEPMTYSIETNVGIGCKTGLTSGVFARYLRDLEYCWLWQGYGQPIVEILPVKQCESFQGTKGLGFRRAPFLRSCQFCDRKLDIHSVDAWNMHVLSEKHGRQYMLKMGVTVPKFPTSGPLSNVSLRSGKSLGAVTRPDRGQILIDKEVQSDFVKREDESKDS